jgi:hypothetical protein
MISSPMENNSNHSGLYDTWKTIATLYTHHLHRVSFKYSHLPPFLPKGSDADFLPRVPAQVFHFKQCIFTAKSQEVGKKRIEVWLGAEMEELVEMCVIDMCEDTEKLAVDVFHGFGEVWREVAACVQVTDENLNTIGDREEIVPALVGNTFSSSRVFCTHVTT